MVYPAHVLLAFGGTLHGVEEWVNTLRLVPNTGPAVDENGLETWLADVEGDLLAFFSQDYFHTGLKVTYAKANNIGPDGKYLSQSISHTRFFGTPISGTGGDAQAPQIACVASLVTGAQRGLASKGRIYFGGLARTRFPVDPATGVLPVLARDSFAGHVQTFLNAINNAPGFDAAGNGLDVHVVSKGSGLRPGVANKVTGVKVGRVLDTQRRRRESLPESYSAVLPVS